MTGNAVATSHSASGLRLDVRAAVACRPLRCADGDAFYLSLFDDEIDERVACLQRGVEPGTIGAHCPVSGSRHLEPTDALIVTRADGTVVVARGGAANFPLYWSRSGESIEISTSLTVDGGSTIWREGLLDSLAVVAVSYRGEPNTMLRSPVAGWHRLRRGAETRFARGEVVSQTPIDHGLALPSATREGLVRSIRTALDQFAARQRRARTKALVELSGGVDSTLAALAAGNHGIALHGVSVHFPFYEFRFEDAIQQDTARALHIPRSVVDGTELYSYAPPRFWPRLDEPATIVMALKRNQVMAELAVTEGTDRVYVGEGGDELFAEDVLEPVPTLAPLPRELFSRRAWQTVAQTGENLRRPCEYGRRSLLTWVYDARLDVVVKDHYGVTTRSPFTDLAMARCGIQWATLKKELGLRQSKAILTEAFGSEMPQAVLSRRDKVPWDGVFARAYAAHGDTILAALDRSSRVLDHLGIDVPWLTRRVRRLSRWECTDFGTDDRLVFSAYAVATWLQSWGIDHPGEHRWTS